MLALDFDLEREDDGGDQYPERRMVAPGQNLVYTATVTNKLLAREAEGLLSTLAAAAHSRPAVPGQTFVLRPQEHSDDRGAVEPSRARGQRRLQPDPGGRRGHQRLGQRRPAGGPVAALRRARRARSRTARAACRRMTGHAIAAGSTTPSTGCTLDPNGYYGSGLKLDGAAPRTRTPNCRSRAAAYPCGSRPAAWTSRICSRADSADSSSQIRIYLLVRQAGCAVTLPDTLGNPAGYRTGVTRTASGTTWW